MHLSVPTREGSFIGVPSLDNQTNDVQIFVAEEGDSRLFHIGSNYLCLV